MRSIAILCMLLLRYLFFSRTFEGAGLGAREQLELERKGCASTARNGAFFNQNDETCQRWRKNHSCWSEMVEPCD